MTNAMSYLNDFRVDPEWAAARTMELVAVPSVTMNEAQVCDLYADQLAGLGLEVDVREVTPGRNNLYARIPGVGGGPTLLLNGHLDTIPVNNCPPPSRDGDTISGRGASDMKGGMAAILAAARALQDRDIRLRGDLWLTAVVGHEEPEAAKDGPLALIDDLNAGRLSTDRIVIAEGRNALWIMSMGSLNFEIIMRSDRGGQHTRHVPFSDNPIRHLGDLIQRIHEFQRELDRTTDHPLAGPERIDIGIVEAGDYFNRTPPLCRLVGTRRWTNRMTADDALDELKALAGPFASAGNLDLTVTMEHQREPFEASPEDPAVEAVASAHRIVFGVEPEHIGERIVGDANLYVAGTGIPTFYYGPSNDSNHSDYEWVSISRIAEVAEVYARAACEFCGVAEGVENS